MAGQSDALASVRNDRIQFVTTRPPSSQLATLERLVVVTGPPELVQLARGGASERLNDLVALLKDPDRAWAAEVMLAAMTGHEGKIVDVFQATPDRWWDAGGRAAHERWSRWLRDTQDRLVWSPSERLFLERPKQ